MTNEEFDFKAWLKSFGIKVLYLVTSRKFWAFIFGILAVVQQHTAGAIDAQTAIWSIVVLIATYSGFQVADDYLTRKATAL